MSMPEIRKHRERQERASRGRNSRTVIKRPAAPERRQRQISASSSGSSGFQAFLRRIPWWSVFFWAAFLALLVLQVFLISGGVRQQFVIY